MSTPNMTLTLPTVGVTAGPAYATQINAALTVVDGHDHSTGSGVQITPAGININADLSINSMNVTDVKTVRFTAQPSALAGTSPNLAALYVVNDDLYYNDGLGNQVAITASGAVAGAPGNITNLVAPASVTYTSGGAPNYKFMSTATESANLDAASLLIRNPGVAATYALTLQAPTLVNNYSVTLPILPASASFLQIDSSGVITATPTLALGITAANLAADAVTTSKILDLNVTNAKIANSTIASSKLAWSPALDAIPFLSSGTYVVPAGIAEIIVFGYGGGGGGGAGYVTGGGTTGAGGGGGSGASIVTTTVPVIPGETLTITIGAGGTGGPNISGTGSPGAVGGSTIVAGSLSTLTLPGGTGGAGGTTGAGGAPGSAITSLATVCSVGGTGGTYTNSGAAGTGSIRVVSGGAGGGTPPGGGGGGGGGSCVGTGGTGGLGAVTVGGGSTNANPGDAAAANSGAGGGGGGGAAGGAGGAGGNGGSGYLEIIIVPLV